MTKIKFILSAAILLALASVIYIVYSLSKNPSQKPSGQVVYQPNIPQFYSSKSEIISNLSADKFKFPGTLPLIKAEKGSEIPEAEIGLIASSLGFTAKPSVVNDTVDGKTYIYSDDLASLVVHAITGTLDYSQNANQRTVNKNLSDKDLIDIGQKFLQEKMLAKVDQLKFSSFVYIKLDDEKLSLVKKESAEFIQVNFDPVNASAVMVTLDPLSSPNFVWVRPDASIARAEVTRLAKLSNTEEAYKIKNLEEVNDSLSIAKIISLDNGSISLSTLPLDSITKTTINDIEIAYLYEKKASLYQPIFLLKGKTKLKNLEKEVDSVYYLPALSQP